MMPHHLRLALATFQIGCGLIALVLCVVAVVYRIDASEESAGMLLGLGSLLGVGLFVVWLVARTRLRWLVALALITGALAVAMIMVTVLAVRPALNDPQFGMWAGAWSGAADVVLWILIMVAALVELRLRVRAPESDPAESVRRRAASQAVAVIAPLAALTALVLLAVTVAPGAMLRLNAETSPAAAPGRHPGSTLTGGTRWSIELEAGGEPVVTAAGLAVPVPSDGQHRAGVIMLDPSTGTPVWRYQLHGTDFPPSLAPTDQGRAIVVSFTDTGLYEDVVAPIHTLDARTGRILATWPERYSLRATDPPVLFDHIAHGTNGVIMLSETGRRMWTYRPERCADPRGVTSTPTVVLVSAHRCDDRGMDLLGLDPDTGERRWRQQHDSDSEDPAEQIDVRPGFQLESDGDTVRRRSLETGEISWSLPEPCTNEPPLTATSERTVYVAACPRSDRPMTLSAYAIDTGERLWRHDLDHPVTSLAAADDRRALVLSSSPKTCSVDLIDSAGRTPLAQAPEDFRQESWSDPKPGSVRCAESAVVRLGASAIVRFEVVGDPDELPGSDPLHRFVGLA